VGRPRGREQYNRAGLSGALRRPSSVVGLANPERRWRWRGVRVALDPLARAATLFIALLMGQGRHGPGPDGMGRSGIVDEKLARRRGRLLVASVGLSAEPWVRTTDQPCSTNVPARQAD